MENEKNQLTSLDKIVKVSIIIGVLIVALSVAYYLVVFLSQREAIKTNIIDLQAKCATQAEKVFNNNWKDGIGDIISYDYHNHYDSKNGKCYILVAGYGVNGQSQDHRLRDVYENGTDIALCSAYGGTHKLDFCSYPNSIGEGFDMPKFDAFVKPYMEE